MLYFLISLAILSLLVPIHSNLDGYKTVLVFHNWFFKHIFYKQLLYKEGSTRQDKNLSKSNTV